MPPVDLAIPVFGYQNHISIDHDFVILSCGYAEEALTWTRAVMAKLGLTLNEAKTWLRLHSQMERDRRRCL